MKRQALDLLGLPKFPHERRKRLSRVGVEPTGDLSVLRGLNAVANPFAYLPMAEEALRRRAHLFREWWATWESNPAEHEADAFTARRGTVPP